MKIKRESHKSYLLAMVMGENATCSSCIHSRWRLVVSVPSTACNKSGSRDELVQAFWLGGQSWACLGHALGSLVPVWGHLEPVFNHLGLVLELSWVALSLSWAYLCHLGGNSGLIQAVLAILARSARFGSQNSPKNRFQFGPKLAHVWTKN